MVSVSVLQLFLTESSLWALWFIGPHLSNVPTTKKWVYAHFHAQIGIYQFDRGRRVRSNPTPSLRWGTQIP